MIMIVALKMLFIFLSLYFGTFFVGRFIRGQTINCRVITAFWFSITMLIFLYFYLEKLIIGI